MVTLVPSRSIVAVVLRAIIQRGQMFVDEGHCLVGMLFRFLSFFLASWFVLERGFLFGEDIIDLLVEDLQEQVAHQVTSFIHVAAVDARLSLLGRLAIGRVQVDVIGQETTEHLHLVDGLVLLSGRRRGTVLGDLSRGRRRLAGHRRDNDG